jgi:hypothetical protein
MYSGAGTAVRSKHDLATVDVPGVAMVPRGGCRARYFLASRLVAVGPMPTSWMIPSPSFIHT